MKKEESIFAEKVDADLKEAFGSKIWIENIQQASKSGTPDRLICLAGRFIALELKTDVGVISPIQQLKLGRISKAGGVALVVTPSDWWWILEQLVKIYV